MSGARQIKRILIANRGEIARRIMRTCHHLGIETVSVYTDVDAHAPHAREATFSEAIGEPESYLASEKIIAAAQRSGADSVHPGYGFLSENANFAAAVKDAGLCWIGPSSETIERLGSKTSAKEIARSSNVPVSPTLLIGTCSVEEASRKISEFGASVGYPLVIKAAAGGGGRGMRFIDSSSSLVVEVESARREALKAFKSDEIFVEKCITGARHIEVQIAADITGAVVALGTRDCSLQRSNQKIIEEAPAINLKPGTEEKLFEAATALARKSRYSNLGTVEFLYTSDGSFYFLEVNTRLQVEHPVTELVTGLDLVELQIRLAAGETLAACGIFSSPQPRGHAIEARWCAEEFTDRFVTATGVVLDLHIPSEPPHGAIVRFDRGVEPCSVVSHYYDSLIGKVIAHSSNREQAISALDETLSGARLSGVRNNRNLLLHLLRTNSFKELTHTVDGTKALLPGPEAHRAGGETAHALTAALRSLSPRSVWAQNGPWLSEQAPDARLSYPWRTRGDGGALESSTTKLPASVVVSGPRDSTIVATLSALFIKGPLQQAVLTQENGERISITTFRDGETLWVHLPFGSYVLEEVGIGDNVQSSAKRSANEIRSSIPGKVAAVLVGVGDVVEEGAVLLVLDSMKMEHPIRASMNGRVSSLPAPVGSIVGSGTPLVTIDPS
jgi:acetyl/propionyl-CoA carboxylase alpha subunit